MSRTFSTVTWGIALLAAAIVLAWAQSLPWALAVAGVVAVLGGFLTVLVDDKVARDAKTAVGEQVKADRAAGQPF